MAVFVFYTELKPEVVGQAYIPALGRLRQEEGHHKLHSEIPSQRLKRNSNCLVIVVYLFGVLSFYPKGS
jgi:hypothetical protein